MMALWEGCRVGRRGPDEARSDAPSSPPLPKHQRQRRCHCGDMHRDGVQLDKSAGTGSPSPSSLPGRLVVHPSSPSHPICPSAHSSHSRPPSSSPALPFPRSPSSRQNRPEARPLFARHHPDSQPADSLISACASPTDPARARPSALLSHDNSSVPPGQPVPRSWRWMSPGTDTTPTLQPPPPR